MLVLSTGVYHSSVKNLNYPRQVAKKGGFVKRGVVPTALPIGCHGTLGLAFPGAVTSGQKYSKILLSLDLLASSAKIKKGVWFSDLN